MGRDSGMTVTDGGSAYGFDLTAEQQRAVDSPAPALVVTSPAGTGKTEVLVRRAERFISDPANKYARMLVVTYTTRAAEEFKSRLRQRLGSAADRVTADTVHGFAHSILSVHGSHVGLPLDFTLINNDEDRAELLVAYEPSWSGDDASTLFRELDLARAKGTAHAQLAAWSNALAYQGAVDFNEMIAKSTEVLSISAVAEMMRNVYGLVLVDEAQNLTQQQYDLLLALIGRHPESDAPRIATTLLGDPNQLVTGFAGGDNKHMESFATDFGAQKVVLSKNFRSSQRLSCLEELLASELGRDTQRRRNGAAALTATGVLYMRKFPNESAEAEFIAEWAANLLAEGLPTDAFMENESCRVRPEEIAVLARHAAALSTVAETLTRNGHEVARAHSINDYMSSDIGKITYLLLKSRSDRHRTEAVGSLRRDFSIELPTESTAEGLAVGAATEASLRGARVSGAEALTPLLAVESLMHFMEVLEGCSPAENESDAVLACWSADRELLQRSWSEFKEITPVRERSWTRFALHIDSHAQARDLGSGIRVLTVHKAQGREFKAVAIAGMNNGQFPDFRAESTDAMQAELQTFYVAATRASRMLLLTRAENRRTRYGDRSTEPSPYLRYVKEACTGRRPATCSVVVG